jgi:hypothetical protein
LLAPTCPRYARSGGASSLCAPCGSLTANQGIVFFIAHPFLYPLLKARLLPAFLLSTFIILNLFFWTYLPQVAFLALFQRNGSAWVNGTFLVLGEGAAVTALLFESFLAASALLSSGGLELTICRMNHKSTCLMLS